MQTNLFHLHVRVPKGSELCSQHFCGSTQNTKYKELTQCCSGGGRLWLSLHTRRFELIAHSNVLKCQPCYTYTYICVCVCPSVLACRNMSSPEVAPVGGPRLFRIAPWFDVEAAAVRTHSFVLLWVSPGV